MGPTAAAIASTAAQRAPCPPNAPLRDHQPATPVNLPLLAQELSTHPDPQFVSQLLHDLQHGADIGFRGPRRGTVSYNLTSALEHRDVVSAALSKEVANGRMAGPYHNPPCPSIHCSGLGTVPKRDGSRRLIMHLSAPPGRSINDGIDPTTCTLHYITVDDAARLVAKHGRGALMSKVDLKSAFRHIPVRRQDWPLLGCFWEGHYYVDKCLPFGLRSSPATFNRLADGLEFILSSNYGIVDLLHYLDDYFTVAPPATDVVRSLAAIQKSTILAVFDALGVMVADGEDKVCGPTTCLKLLGIIFDSVRWEMRLPEDKLAAIQEALIEWGQRRSCTKRELLSLIGTLSFAAKVVPAGRTFVRRLIDVSTSAPTLASIIHIGEEVRADLDWWQRYLPGWNGRSLIMDFGWTKSPEIELYTDASGNWGYGIYFQGRWASQRWEPEQTRKPIEWKELFAIALACRLWGDQWRQKKLLFHCDNEVVVAVMSSGTSSNRDVMHLVRDVFFSAAKGNYVLYVQHIAGTANYLADSLSRGQVDRFRRLAPHADRQPTRVAQPADWWQSCTQRHPF